MIFGLLAIVAGIAFVFAYPAIPVMKEVVGPFADALYLLPFVAGAAGVRLLTRWIEGKRRPRGWRSRPRAS